MKNRWIFGTFAFLAGLALLAGCSGSNNIEDMAEDTAAEVEVMEAEPVERPVVQSYPARLAAYRKAEVRARAAGILLVRNYEEGSEVKEGDLLFSIDDAQLQINVLACKAALARAEAEHQGALDTLRRHSSLLDRKSINEHDHVASVTAEKRTRAEVESAAAELAQAELELSYAKVTAPISGRAGVALVSEGALVGQDGLTPLTNIEQIDPIYVNFSQPVQDLLAVRDAARRGGLVEYPENKIIVQLADTNGGIYNHEGRVVFSDVAVDPDTDNIFMKALFPNPEGILMPGAYTRVNLIRAVNPQVFLVPRDTLVRGEDSSHLFILNDEGLVEKRTVQARDIEDKKWLVTSGIKPGEIIILNSVLAASLEGGKALPVPPSEAAEPEPVG